jgi:uncharacterized protein involved in cysteine biosynthesis
VIAGLVTSVIVFGVGAVLDFALTTNPDWHGFDLQTVGVILMTIGAIGFVLSLVGGLIASTGYRRRRTVVDDGYGNVVRREDRYTNL